MLHGISVENPVRDLFDLIGGKKGWGTPANVDGLHRLALQVVFPELQLPEQRRHHIILPLQGGGEMEIAIGAPLLAERDVQVNTSHSAALIIFERTTCYSSSGNSSS